MNPGCGYVYVSPVRDPSFSWVSRARGPQKVKRLEVGDLQVSVLFKEGQQKSPPPTAPLGPLSASCLLLPLVHLPWLPASSASKQSSRQARLYLPHL